MTGRDLRAARRTLGELWGLGRPLELEEMASVLRIAKPDRLREYEKADAVSGPISVAVDMMLTGAEPPDGRPGAQMQKRPPAEAEGRS